MTKPKALRNVNKILTRMSCWAVDLVKQSDQAFADAIGEGAPGEGCVDHMGVVLPKDILVLHEIIDCYVIWAKSTVFGKGTRCLAKEEHH
uniref:Uncharacterized protein n=1 Tax=Physcomitrium patens TaxID=3218 RepID=A0A2K1ISW4_PHYPA|nr:hypothetical protein PHYPA_026495 [Physcomitrium patens]